MASVLSERQLALMQAYWDAANYLVGDDRVAVDGRVMEVLSEHNCHGWLEGYTLTGRHGIYVTDEAFAMVSASIHDHVREHLDDMPEVRDWTWTD